MISHLMNKTLTKYGKLTKDQKFNTFSVSMFACIVWCIIAYPLFTFIFGEYNATVILVVIIGNVIVAILSHVLWIKYEKLGSLP